MLRLLDDKVAIVAGAAQGIGRAIAEAMAEHGAHVVAADLQSDKAGVVAEGIRVRTRGRALAVQVDVSDRESVASMLSAALAELGRVDILVNNAAILRPHLVVDFPEEAQKT